MRGMQKALKLRGALAAALVFAAVSAQAGVEQVRNMARPLGQRENQISAVGLVVGLNGTGDSNQTLFTQQALANMLSNMGVASDGTIKSRNVAAVLVTADMNAYLKNGDKIDVLVSSMGDASSLAGGTLVQVPLKGADGKVYAVAQGAVSIGEQLGGRIGSLISAKGYRTAGRVPSGAIIENEVPATVVGEDNRIQYILRTPDLSSAARMAMAINDTFKKLKPEYGQMASAKDAKTVEVEIPADFRDYPVEFMAAVEQVEFNPEERSDRVVVNERTGTVVMGFKVTIDSCAVAHGSLNVNVKTTNQASQPAWFQPGASALFYNNQNIDVRGGGANLVTMPETATVADLVSALNAIGASSRDLISILQAIKEAGALHGELEIM
jgi:flagellar P-ring protein precursor FlgI